jgi:glyoxylase-like metal-dependent hydrolase (beta-lactamase superfamily II)
VPGLYSLGTFALRCHLLVCNGEAVLVDTGFLAEYRIVEHALKRLGLRLDALQAVLLTHGHLDHTARLAWFQQRLPQLSVYLHPLDAEHARGCYAYSGSARWCGRLEALGRFLTGFRCGQPTHDLQDRQWLPYFGGLEVIHLPGHTAGHCGFYSRAHDLLLSGDLFASYAWRTHLPPPILNSCPEHFPTSLQRIRDLAPRRLLPNHSDTLNPEVLARRFYKTFPCPAPI